MLSYYLKCSKNAISPNPKVARIKNERIMRLPKCVVYDNKKLKFKKQQEAIGLLSCLGKKIAFK